MEVESRLKRDPYRLRLAGSGGQGLVLAGLIIAEAAMYDDREVIQLQSYGAQARLGSSSSEVIISSRRITSPLVEHPDLLLCLSAAAFKRYFPELLPGAMTVIDATNVRLERPPEAPGVLVHYLPITATAQERLGNRLAANMVALGAINALEDLVSWESLERAVEARVAARFRELDRQALQIGRELAPQAARH